MMEMDCATDDMANSRVGRLLEFLDLPRLPARRCALDRDRTI